MIDIKKEKNNSYRFVVTSEEGNALLQSIPFPTKKELDTTVKKLSPLMKKPSVFERTTNHNGQFQDTSGSIIGSSNTYTSEAGMENGITNVRKRIALLSRSKTL